VARASDTKRGLTEEDDTSSAKYLNGLLLDERRWAFFYRRGRFTLGIASTQRCEGFFAKLKLELGRVGTLRYLTQVICKITACDALESAMLTDSIRMRTSTVGSAKVRHSCLPGRSLTSRVNVCAKHAPC
jgi:hypothetical protein